MMKFVFKKIASYSALAIEAAPDEILETLGSERLQREEKKRVDV